MPHQDNRVPARRKRHSRMTRDERFTDAQKRIAGRLDRLVAAIEHEHPATACLPLPAIELPSSADQLVQLIDLVCDNLFTEHGHRAQRWIDARTRCPHISAERVITVNEMVYWGYQLLCGARHHLDDDPLRDLDWSIECFDRRVPASSTDRDPGMGRA